jgi:diguanylate cyclase (GGDEF)-like protein/PAS domain S-box-containing protein
VTHPTHDLEQQVEELLQFVYLMPVAIIKLGRTGAVEMLNPMAVQLLESLDIDSGGSTGPAIMDALSAGLSAAWDAALDAVGPVVPPLRTSFRLTDGRPLHLVLRVVKPDERCTMLAIEDVTATVEQERALQRNRQQLGFVLERIEGYCVAMLDDGGQLAEWNPSIDRMFGAEGVGLVGAPLSHLLRPPHEVEGFPPFAEVRESVQRDGLYRREAPVRHVGDKVTWGDLVVMPTVDGDGVTSGYVVVIRDVSEQHGTQERLRIEAMTDPLTGLLNRRGLASNVERLSRAPAGSGTVASWIMLDIDHFKRVNDTHGHDGGDAVLKHVAAMLTAFAREGDVVARLGGEEFVVMLPGAGLAAALAAAERLRARIEQSEPNAGGTPLRITSSFGVAVQHPGTPWGVAVQAADEALYRAKEGGRNRVVAADGASSV